MLNPTMPQRIRSAIMLSAVLFGPAAVGQVDSDEKDKVPKLRLVGLGYSTSDVDEKEHSAPMLVANSLPSWRQIRDDHRPYLTIYADGKVQARPGRKELALYEAKLPPKRLADLKKQIRQLVSSDLSLLPSSADDLPREITRYGGVTTLTLHIDGKKHWISWYRSDEPSEKMLSPLYDSLYPIYDAAETGGYERIAEDEKLVDAELKNLGMHDGVADVDDANIKLSNCADCHDTKLSRSGWRWWSGIRFNAWSMGKQFEATIRQDPGGKAFVETMVWRKQSKPAEPLAGSVYDAFTNQPIDQFRIIAGTRRGSGWDSGVYNHNTVKAFDGGEFEYLPEWGDGEQYVRIEADGYYPEPLPLKNATAIVRLRPEDPHTSTVVDENGKPVEGALVALICPDRLASVVDGSIVARFPGGETLADKWRRPATSTTDGFGQFQLPEDPGVQMVAAAHPDFGLGLMSNRAGATPITLSPWATLTGCLSCEGKAAADRTVTVKLTRFHEPGDDETYHATRQEHLRDVLQVQHEVTSNEKGRWRIAKVPAGSYRITVGKRSITVALKPGKRKNVLMQVE